MRCGPERSESVQPLLEPVVRVRLVVERVDLDVAGRPIERDGLVERAVGLQVDHAASSLGGLHLGNVQVTYADMHVFDIWGLKDTPALVIGMDLLTQFEQVALDFGRSKVRFDFI